MIKHRLAPCFTVLMVSLCCLAGAVSAADEQAWQAETTKGVNLRRTPSLSGTVITSLPPGQTVTVLQKRNDWLQVDADGGGYGYRGWIHGSFAKPLTAPAPGTEPPAAETTEAPALAAGPEPDAAAATAETTAEQPPASAEVRPAKDLARELAAQSLGASATEAPAPPVAEKPLPSETTMSASSPAHPEAKSAPASRDEAPPSSSSPPWWAYLEIVLRLATTLLAAAALLIAMRAFQAVRGRAGGPEVRHG